jgi:hypothetical protein
MIGLLVKGWDRRSSGPKPTRDDVKLRYRYGLVAEAAFTAIGISILRANEQVMHPKIVQT